MFPASKLLLQFAERIPHVFTISFRKTKLRAGIFLSYFHIFANHEQSSHPWDSHYRRMNSGTERWDVLNFLFISRTSLAGWMEKRKISINLGREACRTSSNCIRLLLLNEAGSAERARSDEPSSKRRCRSGCMIALCKRPSRCHRQHLDKWIRSPFVISNWHIKIAAFATDTLFFQGKSGEKFIIMVFLGALHWCLLFCVVFRA